tara:strand:+ start:801 stop:1049 length:249 start_codon:yes stop_codon:yes gene_type:complete
MYELVYSDEAVKDLKKLDKQTKVRILSTLERIRVRPHAHVKKLVANPYFRLRIGQHRIILDIKSNKLIIFIIEVGHRKKIYK